MRGSDLLKLSVCAGGSFVMSMALLSPASLDAVEPTTAPVSPVIDQARLDRDGVVLRVDYDGASTSALPISIQPGTPLNLHLLASNSTDRNCEVPVTISVVGTDGPAYSRVLRFRELWRHDERIALSAHQSRTISLQTGVSAAAGQMLTVALQSGDQSRQALRLVVNPSPSGVAVATEAPATR